MERDVQQRLCVAAERMGTGLLRMGAALERLAEVAETQQQNHPPVHDCYIDAYCTLPAGHEGICSFRSTRRPEGGN